MLSRAAVLLVLVGCASPDTQPIDELYEDVPAGGGKEDGAGLIARHAVAEYGAVYGEYTTVDEIHGLLGGSIGAGRPVVAIRRLLLDRAEAYVLVAADTLDVIVADGPAFLTHARDGQLADTPYVASLAGEAHAFSSLAGSVRSPEQTRFALTVDMCQSSRSWEKGFFQGLVRLGDDLGDPVPVGVAMTGRWATAHPRELAQLIAWDASGALDVTWIDHSYNHPVKDAHGDYTFLTDPSIDFKSEVLRLEQLLLGQGVMFSPLFRFPGLTHDAARRGELQALHLFALDADAWLAKKQPIADGAVVLLHGNGNEHHGIEMWNDAMGTWGPRLRDGRAAIVPALDVIAR